MNQLFKDIGSMSNKDIGNTIQFITLIMTIILLIVNIIYTHKNLKQTKELENKKIAADIKAKSRIKWLQEVRSHTSNMISKHTKYLKAFKLCQNHDSDENERLKSESYMDFVESIDFLRLYFVHTDKPKKIDIKDLNDENSELYISIFKDTNEDKHAYIGPLLNELKKQAEQKSKYIEIIIQSIGKYLKIEWDKAKNAE